MSQKGFTLIELLVVLAILGLVVAIVPAYLGNSRDRVELAGAARDIAASLRVVRAEAIRGNRTEAFVIDLDQGWYRGAGSGAAQHLPSGIHANLVTTTDDRLARGRGGIRFFPDGSSTGGGVLLARGARRYDVLVDWLTGRITLADGAAVARR